MIADLQGLGKVHIGEVGVLLKGLPLQPLGVHIPGELDLLPGDHGHLMAAPGQIQAHVPAGIGAANDHHIPAQLVFPAEHVLRQPDFFPVRTLHRGPHRLGSHRREDGVVSLVLEQLRRDLHAGMDRDAGLFKLPDLIVHVFPDGPLVVWRSRRHQLAAQPVRLFVEIHGVAPPCGGDGRLHPRRSGADDCQLFGLCAVGEEIPLPAQLRVHGAGVMAVAPVAADAGHDLLRRGARLELLIVVLIRQELTGHGEQVRLSLPEIPLHQRRIPVAAHRCAGDLNPPRLESGGVVDGMGMILFHIQAVDMGGRAVHAADLDDVHIALQLLAEVQEVLHRIAGGLLLRRDLGLDQEVLSADLLDSAEHLFGQRGPFRHGASTILVGPLVEQRGHGCGQDR